jgi:hypothetical protein
MKSDLVQGFAVIDHFVGVNKTIRICIRDAGGIRSCSRWLSAAIQWFVESEHDFPDVRKMVARWRFADHFVGVNKMVPAGFLRLNTVARQLEAKIAENVVELLEA